MRSLNPVRNRRGIALPLALLGLVIVSFLVTAGIVASGSEVMSSSAHQQATTALYQADGVLGRYVAENARLAGLSTDSLSPTPAGGEQMWGFRFDVARLYSLLDTTGLGTATIADDTVRQFQTYSVLARPATGRGRTVGALLQTTRVAKLFAIQVQAGLTVGGNVKVSGNSTISDGRNTGCAPADNALQVTAGSTITKDGSAVIEGVADTASFDKSQLVTQYLGGLSIRDAAKLATIKFAAGTFSGKPNSAPSGTPLDPVPANKYNWGCPSSDACKSVTGNEKNRAYFPTVSIDGGGGTIKLQGDHGQGILLIYNGSLSIEGNFNYQGIILVEKDLNVKGTGGSSGGVKIDGAVMSLGENSTVEDNASGNAVVTYNQCMISTALQNANVDRIANAVQLFPSRATSWFEMVQ